LAKSLVKIAKELVAWGGFKVLREDRIPKGNPTLKKKSPMDTELEIYTYEEESRREPGKVSYLVLAFMGRSNKPLFHYIYNDEASRDRKIKETVDFARNEYKRKVEKRKERLEYKHTLQIGDILYSSWGYDQTNIDFFQVIAIGEKSVKIREIASKVVSDNGSGQDKVMPQVGKFVEAPMLKKVSNGNQIRINSYSWAYPWDGKPKLETSAGFGH
jgi:hypothetical protein